LMFTRERVAATATAAGRTTPTASATAGRRAGRSVAPAAATGQPAGRSARPGPTAEFDLAGQRSDAGWPAGTVAGVAGAGLAAATAGGALLIRLRNRRRGGHRA